MPELNKFPWDKVEAIWKYTDPEDRRDSMTEHIQSLKEYETEVMERLLLVRSQIDDAENYLKGLD